MPVRDPTDEYRFNCPDYLAQRFWKHCVDQKDTPGAVLRGYMLHEVRKIDPGYSVDQTVVTISERWAARAVARRG